MVTHNLLKTRNVFVALLALGLFTMAARSATDPDLWWHLRTGQLILQSHQIFHVDPYSFTRAGQPWTDHEWLSQILIYSLYKFAGWGGLIAGFAVITATGFMLVFTRCPGRPYVAGVITTWGALASVPCWGVRPQMITFLLASLFLLILERSYERPSLLWWMPILLLFWANLHAGYALALMLMLLFLIGDLLDAAFGFAPWQSLASHSRKLLLATVLCVAVVSVNPYGTQLYSYPLETLRSHAMQTYINEWFSPDFHQGRYLPALLMMLATVALPMVSPARLRPRDLLLLIAAVYMALLSVRHVPIYILVAVPLLSALVRSWLEQQHLLHRLQQPAGSLSMSKAWVNALLFAGFLAFTVARVNYVLRQQTQSEGREFPQAAVSFVSVHRPSPPMLNHYNWGGYLIWRLYPEYKVFIDGRADVYGDSFMDDFAATYFLKGDSWQAPLEKWNIQTVILPPDAPLVAALEILPHWQSIYADSQAVILARTK